ncbi:MAG: hypothetical protein ACNYPE_02420 [Candidatus Azotimanducaceae bacterium WSBS_2022_MAG_OTU7]
MPKAPLERPDTQVTSEPALEKHKRCKLSRLLLEMTQAKADSRIECSCSPDYAAAKYLADSMEMWLILLIPWVLASFFTHRSGEEPSYTCILQIDHGVGVMRLNHKNAEINDLSDKLRDAQFDVFVDIQTELPIVKWQDGLKWIGENR